VKTSLFFTRTLSLFARTLSVKVRISTLKAMILFFQNEDFTLSKQDNYSVSKKVLIIN
jgi:hypothetical protein